MAKISPYVFVQELDNNGNPLAGGKIFTYEAGTTTPKETFTDSEEGTANANPVVLDAAGRADVWLGSGSYKFILKDANDVTIKEVDNVTGDASNVFGSSIVSVSTNTAITSSFQNNIVEASGTITLSLFSASLAGEGFLFSVKNTGLGVVTIDPDGSETIDGQASHTIYAGEWAFIVCDGTNWITLPYSFSFSKPTATITASDNILFSDVDDGNNVKKTTVQGVIDLVPIPQGVPTGTILDFAGDTAPSNYFLCHGQDVSRTTYNDLFVAIGTTYGAGDGSTTFNIPDLRGRVSAGKDDMGGAAASRLTLARPEGVDGSALGNTGGAESHTLNVDELAAHDHDLIGAGGSSGPQQGLAKDSNANNLGDNLVGNTGGDEAHNNVQPTIVLNKIIRL